MSERGGFQQWPSLWRNERSGARSSSFRTWICRNCALFQKKTPLVEQVDYLIPRWFWSRSLYILLQQQQLPTSIESFSGYNLEGKNVLFDEKYLQSHPLFPYWIFTKWNGFIIIMLQNTAFFPGKKLRFWSRKKLPHSRNNQNSFYASGCSLLQHTNMNLLNTLVQGRKIWAIFFGPSKDQLWVFKISLKFFLNTKENKGETQLDLIYSSADKLSSEHNHKKATWYWYYVLAKLCFKSNAIFWCKVWWRPCFFYKQVTVISMKTLQ